MQKSFVFHSFWAAAAGAGELPRAPEGPRLPPRQSSRELRGPLPDSPRATGSRELREPPQRAPESSRSPKAPESSEDHPRDPPRAPWSSVSTALGGSSRRLSCASGLAAMNANSNFDTCYVIIQVFLTALEGSRGGPWRLSEAAAGAAAGVGASKKRYKTHGILPCVEMPDAPPPQNYWNSFGNVAFSENAMTVHTSTNAKVVSFLRGY